MRLDDMLREVIGSAVPILLGLDPEASGRPRSPGTWSPRQILGHLIDSACNNHGRFVRAQLGDDLVFAGYDQDAWVAVQQYATADWPDLVELWRRYNLHLASVVGAIPDAQMTRSRPNHNLHEIGWRPVPPDRPATLDDLVRDYIGHLEHHLAQIIAGYRPRSFDVRLASGRG